MRTTDEGAINRKYDLIGSGLAIVALVILFINVIPVSTVNYSGWAYSEWQINYEGGFVRRGLFGELLLLFKDQVRASNILVLIIDCLFITLGTFYLCKLKGPRKRAFLATFFLGTFGILNHLINNQYYFRKEYLGFIMILFLLLIRDQISKNFFSVLTALSFLLVFIATLNHESFLFAHIGLLVFLFWNVKASTTQKLMALGLIIIPVIIVSYYHGYKTTADLIWLSISEENRTEIPAENAIEAISWDLKKSLSLSTYIFTHLGQLAYWFTVTVIFFTQAVLVFLYLKLTARHLLIFLLLNVGLIPLFFLGWDWGRWFNIMIFNLSIIILKLEDYKAFVHAISEKLNQFKPLQSVFNKMAGLTNFKTMAVNSSFLLIFFLLINVLNVPECCITRFKDFVTVLFK